MFTRLETEENDVFCCNICDDIFVSEASIKKHIVEVHDEKDFEDPGSNKDVEVKGLNSSEKENNERQGQDSDQPWWMEDIFYVCDVCYEIFSHSPGLRDHHRLQHSRTLVCNGNTGETTGAEDEKDEMKLTVNTNILNSNSPGSTKLLKSKITKRSISISKKEIIPPRNVQDNPPTAIKRDDGENRSSSSCFKCGLKCKSLLHRKNHILSHYYSAFYSVLPTSNPYVCPQCGQTSRDRITLIRHFAFSHKKMFEFTGVTEDLLLLK